MSAVLLLHNTLTSRAVFERLALRQTHAIDFRAHGARMNETAAYDARDLLLDVQAYADAHGLEKFSVVGSSMGASVAVMLAATWPERVDKLVLTGANLHAATLRERAQMTVEAALLRRVGAIPPFVSIACNALFSPHTHEATRAPWREYLRRLPGPAIAAAMRAWRDRPELSNVAATLRLPVLFVAGSHDASCPPALAQQMKARMPTASLELIDAGHMAPYEQPERFSALVRAFL